MAKLVDPQNGTLTTSRRIQSGRAGRHQRLEGANTWGVRGPLAISLLLETTRRTAKVVRSIHPIFLPVKEVDSLRCLAAAVPAAFGGGGASHESGRKGGGHEKSA